MASLWRRPSAIYQLFVLCGIWFGIVQRKQNEHGLSGVKHIMEKRGIYVGTK